ncbi:MAG: pyridoxal phosphate-dependent aminotransferase [Oscillospiraceae bacterium]|jgi:aspartate aminotransferase|nr:pyridoxal phosphate-dependent aminotransferase [Oscillospiraceae bacterium]
MPLTLSALCQKIAPSVTLAIDTKAKAMKASGIDIIGFGAGEPDFPTPEAICDAARAAIASGYTRYTAATGIPELKQAVCTKLVRDNDLTYSQEQIIISNGAKQALLGALLAVVNPGDEVIIPTPCWVSYPEMVRMAGGKPVYVPMDERDGYSLSMQRVSAAVTRRTKAMILNTPHNPTGSVVPLEQLKELAELAVAKHFYIIADEIYEKLVFDGATHYSIAGLGEAIKSQTILVNGVSKSYAMTGWRIGYAAGPVSVIKLMGAYQSHATSNPNSIAQYASIEALNNGAESIERMRQAFEQRRERMLARISAIPELSCITPKGAFYVMLNIRGMLGWSFEGNAISDAMTLSALLLEHAHLAVVPGEAFEAPDTCRLSYAVSLEDIDRGMDRIEGFIKSLKPAHGASAPS